MPPKKSTTKNLPGAIGIGNMGGLVRLDDVTRPQGRIVPDATSKNSGVMTKEQATQLAILVAGGGGGGQAFAFNVRQVTGPVAADFRDLIDGDPTGGKFTVSLPLASSVTLGGSNIIAIKNESTSPNHVTALPHDGDTIDGGGSIALTAGEYLFLVSDGVSNWVVIAVSAPPQLPSVISPLVGLVAWLRSDAGVTVDGGGNVTAWADQSGAGVISQYVQTAPYAAPTFAANGGPNNLPRLLFGSTAGLLAQASLLVQGGAKTIIVVGKANSTAGGALFTNKQTSPVFTCQIVEASGQMYLGSDGSTQNIQVNGGLPGALRDTYQSPFIACFSSFGTNDLLGVRLNGKGCPTDGKSVPVDSGAAGTIIGNRENVANQLGWEGEIYEILVYSNVLTDPQVNEIQAYLSLKYGIIVASESVMRMETSLLWPGAPPIGSGNATIHAFIPPVDIGATDPVKRPAVIYCPGGGYTVIDDSAGRDVCSWLAALGIVAVLLEYRLPDAGLVFPGSVSVSDIQRCVRMLRAGPLAGVVPSIEWGVDPDRIGVAGESAGGHLASTACTHYDAGNPANPDPVEQQSDKPNFSLLLWAITWMENPYQYPPGTAAFIGASGLNVLYTNALQIDHNTPPAFLTWADDDAVVDPENSITYRDNLIVNGVELSNFINFPTGNHGEGFPGSEDWVNWKRAFYTWLQQTLPNPAQPANLIAVPTFQNGVTNLGSGFQAAQYYKDNFGVVHLDGVLTGGIGPNVVLFTLPAGLRPAGEIIAICAGSVGGAFTAARLNIGIDGTVTHVSGGGDFLSLVGITFFATQ